MALLSNEPLRALSLDVHLSLITFFNTVQDGRHSLANTNVATTPIILQLLRYSLVRWLLRVIPNTNAEG